MQRQPLGSHTAEFCPHSLEIPERERRALQYLACRQRLVSCWHCKCDTNKGHKSQGRGTRNAGGIAVGPEQEGKFKQQVARWDKTQLQTLNENENENERLYDEVLHGGMVDRKHGQDGDSIDECMTALHSSMIKDKI